MLRVTLICRYATNGEVISYLYFLVAAQMPSMCNLPTSLMADTKIHRSITNVFSLVLIDIQT